MLVDDASAQQVESGFGEMTLTKSISKSLSFTQAVDQIGRVSNTRFINRQPLTYATIDYDAHHRALNASKPTAIQDSVTVSQTGI